MNPSGLVKNIALTPFRFHHKSSSVWEMTLISKEKRKRRTWFVTMKFIPDLQWDHRPIYKSYIPQTCYSENPTRRWQRYLIFNYLWSFSVNFSYLLGDFPQNPKSPRKSPETQKKCIEFTPPPPDMWFPRTQSRIHTDGRWAISYVTTLATILYPTKRGAIYEHTCAKRDRGDLDLDRGLCCSRSEVDTDDDAEGVLDDLDDVEDLEDPISFMVWLVCEWYSVPGKEYRY